MNDRSKVMPLRAKHPCPECGRPSARDSYPFCSQRCKDLDLNRWLSGRYVIPATEEETDGNGEESLSDRS